MCCISLFVRAFHLVTGRHYLLLYFARMVSILDSSQLCASFVEIVTGRCRSAGTPHALGLECRFASSSTSATTNIASGAVSCMNRLHFTNTEPLNLFRMAQQIRCDMSDSRIHKFKVAKNFASFSWTASVPENGSHCCATNIFPSILNGAVGPPSSSQHSCSSTSPQS